MKTLLRVTGLAFALFLSTACTHVEPWQRGVLAKPQMALDASAMQSTIRSHTYSSREAASSANSSGGGGGCGCY